MSESPRCPRQSLRHPRSLRQRNEKSTDSITPMLNLGVKYVCVQGQGEDKHHKRKEEWKEHIIYSDYLFFNKDGHIIDKETGLKQKGLVTVLTAICKDSQFPFAIVVSAKGGNEYAIKALIAWIEELGWDKVTIQVDQENSLHKLYDEVKKRMPEKKVKT